MVPKFAGSNPAEAVGFFRAKKNPQHAFLRKGSKAVCPMSHICGMQKNAKAYAWKSQLSAEITGHLSFHYYGLWWRHLAVQVGTTKDQGL